MKSARLAGDTERHVQTLGISAERLKKSPSLPVAAWCRGFEVRMMSMWIAPADFETKTTLESVHASVLSILKFALVPIWKPGEFQNLDTCAPAFGLFVSRKTTQPCIIEGYKPIAGGFPAEAGTRVEDGAGKAFELV